MDIDNEGLDINKGFDIKEHYVFFVFFLLSQSKFHVPHSLIKKKVLSSTYFPQENHMILIGRYNSIAGHYTV